jgi:hypothetical protein
MNATVQDVLEGDFPNTICVVIELDADAVKTLFEGVPYDEQVQMIATRTLRMQIIRPLSDAAIISAVQNELRMIASRAESARRTLALARNTLARQRMSVASRDLKGKKLKF